MAGWMNTPLGTDVDLSPGHIVLHGNPAAPRKRHSSLPVFEPCLLWPRSPISATAELLFLHVVRAYLLVFIYCSLLRRKKDLT